MSIYVGNLAFEVEDKHLSEVFSDYGKVTRVYMPTDRETGQRRGFAFVEMETAQMEDAAISALDGAEWMDRELKVNKARERENGNSGGGGNYRRNSNSGGGGNYRRNDRY